MPISHGVGVTEFIRLLQSLNQKLVVMFILWRRKSDECARLDIPPVYPTDSNHLKGVFSDRLTFTGGCHEGVVVFGCLLNRGNV
jgi:hypothetical protein